MGLNLQTATVDIALRSDSGSHMSFFMQEESMKILAGVIGGFVLAVIGALLVALGSASSPAVGATAAAITFFVLWIIGFIVALKVPGAAKAWRRLLMSAGILAFMLPLSGIIFTGAQVASQLDAGGDHAVASAAGAALGGSLISGIAGFVGFFLGSVLLIIGLLVGRDTRVVIIREAAPPAPAQ